MQIGKWLRPFNPFINTKTSVSNDLANKVSGGRCEDFVQLKNRVARESDPKAKANLAATVDIIEASAAKEHQSDRVTALATGLGIVALAASSVAIVLPPLGIAAFALIGSGAFLSPMADDFHALEDQTTVLRQKATKQGEKLARANAEKAGEKYESPRYVGEHKHWKEITGEHHRLNHYTAKWDEEKITAGAEQVARMSYLIAT